MATSLHFDLKITTIWKPGEKRLRTPPTSTSLSQQLRGTAAATLEKSRQGYPRGAVPSPAMFSGVPSPAAAGIL